MSDKGYIAVKQSEDRNYGTVAMTEEGQSPSVAEEAPSTQQVRINVLELAYLIHRTDLLRPQPHLYSTEGGWSTMTLLLTPTYNTTGILLRHDPPSRHCYRHGAGGELSDDGLTERVYTPYISFDTFPPGSPAEEVSGGDLEDMEENCNEGSLDLPDPPKPEVGAYHQPCSLHRRQVLIRDPILVVFGNLLYF